MNSKYTYIEKSKFPVGIPLLLAIQTCILLLISKAQDLIWVLPVLVSLLLLSILGTFVLKLDSRGLSYRYIFTGKNIAWNQIKSIEIIKDLHAIIPLGVGIKYSKTYGWIYGFGSDTAIHITLTSGCKKVLQVKDMLALETFVLQLPSPYKDLYKSKTPLDT